MDLIGIVSYQKNNSFFKYFKIKYEEVWFHDFLKFFSH